MYLRIKSILRCNTSKSFFLICFLWNTRLKIRETRRWAPQYFLKFTTFLFYDIYNAQHTLGKKNEILVARIINAIYLQLVYNEFWKENVDKSNSSNLVLNVAYIGISFSGSICNCICVVVVVVVQVYAIISRRKKREAEKNPSKVLRWRQGRRSPRLYWPT